MKLNILVKPNKKAIKVKRISANQLQVSLTAKTIDNQANIQLIKVLSQYLKKSPNKILIKKGLKSKIKQVLVLDKV
jgi:uncharacterized protein YggU (UPF0235/DUF167 family)